MKTQSNKLESIKCNLCGKDDYKHIITVKGINVFSYKAPLTYVECRNCSLVYTNPRPNQKKIEEQYHHPEYHNKNKPFELGQRAFRNSINVYIGFLEYVERFKGKGRILDIGSDEGYFLDLMRMKGWDTYGLEISDFTKKFSTEQLKLNVYKKYMEEHPFKKGFFDVVTFRNLLEHTPNPSLFLKKVYEVLKKDGIAVIDLPNYNCLYRYLRGKKWPGYMDPGQHLYNFTRKTLSMMLKKNGFKVIHFFTHNGWFGDFTRRDKNIAKYFLRTIFRVTASLTNLGSNMTFVCKKR